MKVITSFEFMNSHLISIIVPCYNVQKFIDKTLDCILNQTYHNWECILVNDGSKDETERKIEPWLKKDRRFKYYYQNNQGLSGARNTGLKFASGNYVYFFDSDDLIPLNALENLYKLTPLNTDIIFGKCGCTIGQTNQVFKHLDHTPKTNTVFNNDNKQLLKLVIEEPLICVAWNRLYKKEFLDKHSLTFKKGILHEDELWFFETIFASNSIILVDDTTYYYNVANTESITQNFGEKNLDSYIEIVQFIFDNYYLNPKLKKDVEIISIYITHLKLKIIEHCFKQLPKNIQKETAYRVEDLFKKISPKRTKKLLNKTFENKHYSFKKVKHLSAKTILDFLRYQRSKSLIRQLKKQLILLKARQH